MKLQPDKFDVQSITGYGPGWVGINTDKVLHSVVVGSRGERLEWHCSRFEDLTPEHFAQLAAMGPELVIFGSGSRIRFPQPVWLKPLMAQRIGIETMDTQAACRTYNILAQEGRHVVVALLLEPAA
ncbi:Mth938-like domain-containing protein [Rhodoferax sp.]|uniref:Mth938-like domain-containing protein n=1 Tax=Rhodoferax sp. TaxID=50421 RepID=UPI0025D6148C|nr:Mth938-like domain-containing protein [Rhodoferax sp.]